MFYHPFQGVAYEHVLLLDPPPPFPMLWGSHTKPLAITALSGCFLLFLGASVSLDGDGSGLLTYIRSCLWAPVLKTLVILPRRVSYTSASQSRRNWFPSQAEGWQWGLAFVLPFLAKEKVNSLFTGMVFLRKFITSCGLEDSSIRCAFGCRCLLLYYNLHASVYCG